MAKSKKELLAARQKVGRPSLRREVITNPDQEAAVVQKVSDNPPPPAPKKPAARKPRTTAKKATPKADAPTAKKPTTRAKKTSESRKKTEAKRTEEKEPFMRMTFDVPKSLHLELKMYAIKNGITIKEHMLRIIRESIK